ncbi:hypothetical protein BC829DRAFT_387331 [Chytridium lagenaria]|nr:hypothetical protein BC829DRAFT_387331 [Chytridium lagenaria]
MVIVDAETTATNESAGDSEPTNGSSGGGWFGERILGWTVDGVENAEREIMIRRLKSDDVFGGLETAVREFGVDVVADMVGGFCGGVEGVEKRVDDVLKSVTMCERCMDNKVESLIQTLLHPLIDPRHPKTSPSTRLDSPSCVSPGHTPTRRVTPMYLRADLIDAQERVSRVLCGRLEEERRGEDEKGGRKEEREEGRWGDGEDEVARAALCGHFQMK